jgi:hypothetical protein
MAGGLFGLGRQRTMILGGLAAAIVVLAIVLILRSLGSSPTRLAANATSTSSTTSTSIDTGTTLDLPTVTSEVTTTPPSVTTTARATATTSATPTTVVVSPNGALLQPVPQPATQSTEPPTADCHSLGDSGWTVAECNTFNQTGPSGTNTAVALVEKKQGSGPSNAWRAYILHFSQGKGTWLRDLAYADNNGYQVDTVSYVAKDMNGDGVNEVVFGFRMQGSGGNLGYDIVDRMFTGVRVGAHRDLSHGQAKVATTGVTEWDAKYEGNAPNCCPTYIQQSKVSWNGAAWVLTTGPRVKNAGPGDF